MKPRRFFVASLTACLAAAFSCGPETDFERNCAGETVPNCLPREISIVEVATLTPDRVVVDDRDARIQIHVELSRCSDPPRRHEVGIQMLTLGDSPRIFDILTVRDDGEMGDAVADDGVIDKDLGNPFIGPELPDGVDVNLSFQSRGLPDCTGEMCFGGTCTSERMLVPYRLGRRPEML